MVHTNKRQMMSNGEAVNLGGLTDVKVVLEARGIRIGSLRGQTFAPVIISTSSIQLNIESEYLFNEQSNKKNQS